MSRQLCTKELYQTFLSCSSLRYSGVALSDVSPQELSHDSVSRWLNKQHLRSREVWQRAQHSIDKEEPCVLIVDDTVLSKTHSKKIELVHSQYSGNVHQVTSGIGLVNFLWRSLSSKQSVPIDSMTKQAMERQKTRTFETCCLPSVSM